MKWATMCHCFDYNFVSFSLNFNIKNVYQRSCRVDGAVTIKVKGHLTTEDLEDTQFSTSVDKTSYNLYKRSWDAEDLIHPPFGDTDGSFLAVTNLLITPNQTRKICPEVCNINIFSRLFDS